MTAMELHARLLHSGFALTLRDGVIVVAPASQLAEADRELLTLHKAALLLILAGEGPQLGCRIFYQPDPAREKETVAVLVDGKRARLRRGIRPRFYTWEKAGQWFPTSPPGEG
jgi:hypothetical protein